MKFSAPIIPIIWSHILFYFSGLKIIFTPKLFTIDYRKHFTYSYLFLTGFCLIVTAYFGFDKLHLYQQVLICAFFGFFGNGVREVYKLKVKKIKPDYMDCVVGAWGAKLAPIVISILAYFI